MFVRARPACRGCGGRQVGIRTGNLFRSQSASTKLPSLRPRAYCSFCKHAVRQSKPDAQWQLSMMCFQCMMHACTAIDLTDTTADVAAKLDECHITCRSDDACYGDAEATLAHRWSLWVKQPPGEVIDDAAFGGEQLRGGLIRHLDSVLVSVPEEQGPPIWPDFQEAEESFACGSHRRSANGMPL